MLDNLLEIEVAYNLLRDEAAEDKTKNPIDANYEKLNTDITVSISVHSDIIVFIYMAVYLLMLFVNSLVRIESIVSAVFFLNALCNVL